jgi:hypothetical protein
MSDTFKTGVAQGWAVFMTFIPKLLLFVAILVIGYYVAKFTCKILDRVLDRVGFNRLVERGGVKSALSRSGWDASQILSKTLSYFVMLFVLQLAFGVFGPNPVSNILTSIIAFLPKVFAAVVIVILAAAIAAGAKQLIQVALGGLSYGRFLGGAASVAILFVGIAAALNEIGVAPAIVNGLFYAVLAIVAGSTIIAVGGGGIAPMRAQWEKALGRIEREAPRIREEMARAPERVEAETESWKQKAQEVRGEAQGPAVRRSL